MSNTKDTSGPAFPNASIRTDRGVDVWGHGGMTLRDYFAASALSSILSPHPVTGQCALVTDFEECAIIAYNMADAMLKAREQ